MRPYIDQHNRWRLASRLLVPAGLALICFIYGFFFALTAPYLILVFTVPVVMLGLLAIWALPEANTAPVKTLEVFFTAGLAGLILWPNYLALTLPGLPWVTMVRLTMFPMAFLLLLSLSMSKGFRQRIFESTQGVPSAVFLLLLFAGNSLISLPFAAHRVGDSLNRLIIQQLTWTGMFIAGLYLFHLPKRGERYVGFVLLLGVPIAAVAFAEFQEQHLLWSAHVPSFLKVADASAQLALTSSVRGATGLYRSKATFSTPLGLAEYMSLMTPFAVHWAVGPYPRFQRLIGLAMLPVIYIVVRMTDARLGILGYLISILAYVLVWSLIRFRHRLNDLVSAIIVYAYPAAMIGVLAASMFVHKIHVLLFGGGAQAGSNAHREEQFRMALPAFLRNPIGYGTGQSGAKMGYAPGDFVAIDSYWISLSLDYGALGMVLYIGLFAVVIHAGIKALLRHPDAARSEIGLLLPLTSFLASFLVIRGVFSQPDIHPLVFTLLGLAVCLISRARNGLATSKLESVLSASIPHHLKARMVGGIHPGDAKKPMGRGMVLAIVLGCAAAYYAGCLVWRLAH
jgi:hypothetical protein